MSHEFKISFRDQLLCNCCIIYNSQSFDYVVNLLVKVFESLFCCAYKLDFQMQPLTLQGVSNFTTYITNNEDKK